VSGTPPLPPSARKRILVAEDDADIARLLHRVLGTDYAVTVATNGLEAIQLATEKAPQLLLLDIMMPGVDGLDAARRIRELPGLNHVPIIFLTAKDGPLDVIKGIQSGARHYVTKPFKIEELVAKVNKILKP
jgi:DNA-binding response OmpR family regulator